MIRRAVFADIGPIMTLGLQFFRDAGWSKLVAWDDVSFHKTMVGFIDGKVPGGLLVAEYGGGVVGMAAFLVYPLYFNFAESVAQEIFWYVDPDYRNGIGGELLDALEQSAKEQGASVFIMGALAGMRDEALARVYTRRGYAPAENTFIRKLYT